MSESYRPPAGQSGHPAPDGGSAPGAGYWQRAPQQEPPAPVPPPFEYGQVPPGAGYGYGPMPGAGLQPGAPPPYPSRLDPADERTWATLAHVGGFLGSVVGLPFLGPLLVMLIQGPKSAFVRAHAVEALNFQITTLIAALVSLPFVLVLIGIPMLIAVGIAWIVFPILAAVAANRGEPYRYPVTLRVVK